MSGEPSAATAGGGGSHGVHGAGCHGVRANAAASVAASRETAGNGNLSRGVRIPPHDLRTFHPDRHNPSKDCVSGSDAKIDLLCRSRASVLADAKLTAAKRLQHKLRVQEDQCCRDQIMLQRRYDLLKRPLFEERGRILRNVPFFWTNVIGRAIDPDFDLDEGAAFEADGDFLCGGSGSAFAADGVLGGAGSIGAASGSGRSVATSHGSGKRPAEAEPDDGPRSKRRRTASGGAGVLGGDPSTASSSSSASAAASTCASAVSGTREGGLANGTSGPNGNANGNTAVAGGDGSVAWGANSGRSGQRVLANIVDVSLLDNLDPYGSHEFHFRFKAFGGFRDMVVTRHMDCRAKTVRVECSCPRGGAVTPAGAKRASSAASSALGAGGQNDDLAIISDGTAAGAAAAAGSAASASNHTVHGATTQNADGASSLLLDGVNNNGSSAASSTSAAKPAGVSVGTSSSSSVDFENAALCAEFPICSPDGVFVQWLFGTRFDERTPAKVRRYHRMSIAHVS
eukprot:gene432-350_t